MKIKITSNSGFTLLELMVAISIFSILIIAVYGTFFSEYSRMNRQLNLATMNTEANRTMVMIKEVIDDYGDITVSSNRVLSNGVIIIDASDNGRLDGRLMNVDYDRHSLLDENGGVISEHIASINFRMGPASYEGVDVTRDVVLIIVALEAGDMSHTLKGGINVER